MGVIPFPEPKPEPDKSKPKPEKHALLGVFPMGMLNVLIEAVGDMTVGDALAEISQMPLKDVLGDLIDGFNGKSEQ
jgi:hypothetical protein